MPEVVLMYDDLHGRCISEEASPNILVIVYVYVYCVKMLFRGERKNKGNSSNRYVNK